jgi:quinol monooxygenase YgiN
VLLLKFDSLGNRISSLKTKGVYMLVRQMFLKIAPERINEVKDLYRKEIIPTLRKVKGCSDARFLVPTVNTDEFIAFSEWKTKADVDLYENGPVYKELRNKVTAFTTKEPVLKVYTFEKVEELIPEMH